MIDRRVVLGGALSLIAAPLARAALPAIPPSRQLGFDVWRGTRKLGTHDLVFHPRPDGLQIDVAVDIAFRLGPITLYRYVHHASERWANGAVAEISSETDDNGTRHRVFGKRELPGLMIHPDGAAPYLAPPDALPATHWNHHELNAAWINTQSGELIRPRVAPPAPVIVQTAAGAPLRVRRYALSGPVRLDLWYDEADTWAGLSFVKGGGEVRYARRS